MELAKYLVGENNGEVAYGNLVHLLALEARLLRVRVPSSLPVKGAGIRPLRRRFESCQVEKFRKDDGL